MGVMKEDILNRGCAGRQSAEDVLLQKIKRVMKEHSALVAIHQSILWDKLTEEQESLLWDYFIRVNNR